MSSSEVSPSRRTSRRSTVRSYRTTLKLAGVGAAAIALVTACSSSGSSSPSSGSSSTGASSSASAAKSLTTLTLDAAFFGPIDVPLYYAEAKGYFAQQGVDVKFVVASSNTQLASVLGGSVQFASTDPINTINAAKNGAQFVNFMPIEIGYSEDVIMSSKAYAAAGRQRELDHQPEDRGSRQQAAGVISTTGENGIIFKYMFKSAGIPSSELHMVQLGTPAAIMAALKEGTVDGANLGSPYPAEGVAAGYAD